MPRSFRTVEDILGQEDPKEIVENLVSEGGITNLIGNANVGKGFVMLSLSFAIGRGVTWLGLEGFQTVHGSVLYVGYEMEAMRLRLEALHKQTGKKMENFYHYQATHPISAKADSDQRSKGEQQLTQVLQEVAAYIKGRKGPPLRLLIVDTYRASLKGDENSSEAAAEYTGVLRRVLSAHPEVGAIVSAHVGWEEKSRERGSSGIRGAVEYALILREKKGGNPKMGQLLCLSGLKARDTKVEEGVYMYRKMVEVGGSNQWGRPRSSCAITPDDLSPEKRAAQEMALKLAAQERAMFVLLTTIRDQTLTNQNDLFQTAGIGQTTGRSALRMAADRRFTDTKKSGHPFTLTPKGLAEIEKHAA